MVKIYHSNRKIKVSDLGGENSLPVYSAIAAKFGVRYAKEIPKNILANGITEGHFKMLPYLIQDQYNREQKDSTLPVIILENSKLKATFYPQYGGRLASLFDKVKQKELLFDNPVFQPANLALRNAWFSGGIEWNGPIYGHTLLTCAPVYFAKVKTGNEEILRIYEYDRMLNTTWQVDIYLPEDSAQLWYHVTARNLNPTPISYYWWTNIAAPLNDKIRFMVSSERSFNHFFEDLIAYDWPIDQEIDISYPRNYRTALSMFYYDTKEKIPWFSYADESGYGLFHFATPNLVGKKLWYFGYGQGGTNWMDTLSLTGKGQYIEIQAGITETQLQVIPLAGNAEINWTACIGPVTCDAKQVHQKNYDAAVEHSRKTIENDGHFAQLDAIHKKMVSWQDITPDVVLHEGEAWGSLQERMSGKKIPGLLFTAPITEKEQPWYELITENKFLNGSLLSEPKSWNISKQWQDKIQASIDEGYETWLHHLHLAASYMEQSNLAKARAHFEKSIQLKSNFQSLRGIAIIEQINNNTAASLDWYFKAWKQSNGNKDMFLELIRILVDKNEVEWLLKLAPECPKASLSHEFMNLANAIIALHKKQFADARKYLVREYTYIREGNFITTNIWFDSFYKETEQKLNRTLTDSEKENIRTQNPPPAIIDFQMKN